MNRCFLLLVASNAGGFGARHGGLQVTSESDPKRGLIGPHEIIRRMPVASAVACVLAFDWFTVRCLRGSSVEAM